MRNPIMLALDVDDLDRAENLAKNLGPYVGALKIGPRLVVRYGEALVRKLASYAPVFLDHKFLDIPSTTCSSVRAAFDAGASFTTVHAWSGEETLKALATLEIELNRTRPFRILCVTILTSFEQSTLPPLICEHSIVRHVRALAESAVSCGLRGIVCSPHEIEWVRSLASDLFIVTPGIRLDSASAQDQKRFMTPGRARAQGASALVIGRPILDSADPRGAIESILHDLAHPVSRGQP